MNNTKMNAVVFDEPGPAENLKIGRVNKPTPKENEILVEVKATALNRADILQRQGKYPPPKGASKILGLEIAGVVSESKSGKWEKGERVFGLIPGGGYAEFAVINEDMAMAIPTNLNFTEAAAIPEVFLTAFQALILLGELKEGESVLIHAGGSGVGTAAIQISHELKAKVIITSSKEKHDICKSLGAEKTIDYKTVAFDEEVLAFTDGEGVDLILDFIAGPYFGKNLTCLKKKVD